MSIRLKNNFFNNHMSKEIDAIIEIPKDSKVKYEFCKETSKIRVDRILPSAYNYPFNYGYIENTLAEDGDALDIIIINDQPIYPTSVIKVRPIGVLLMRDGVSEDNLENDPKIISCPAQSVDKRYKYMSDIDDIPDLDKMILKDFFSNYKNNENKVTRVDGFAGKDEAWNIINKSITCYENKLEENTFNLTIEEDNEKDVRRSQYKKIVKVKKSSK